MEEKNMKMEKSTSKKPIYEKVEKFIVKIYLKDHKFCKFKSIPLTEEQVDQLYKELNMPEPVMEFDTFYFNKNNLDYIRLKKVIVKELVNQD